MTIKHPSEFTDEELKELFDVDSQFPDEFDDRVCDFCGSVNEIWACILWFDLNGGKALIRLCGSCSESHISCNLSKDAKTRLDWQE